MAVSSYGSVDGPGSTPTVDPEMDSADAAVQPVDHPFDADHAYYLKADTGGRRMWTNHQIWSMALPILVAALLVGGAAAFLLRDFGTLYPGGGNGGSDTSRAIPNESTHTNKEMTYNGKSSSTSSSPSSGSSTRHHSFNSDIVPPSDDGANCEVHPDCSSLIGKCCPTADGKMLECCKF
jgi:hypothetical protein